MHPVIILLAMMLWFFVVLIIGLFIMMEAIFMILRDTYK